MGYLAVWLQKLLHVGWIPLLTTIIDVILVSMVIYWLMMLAKRTRAWQIMWGLAVFFLIVYITRRLDLVTINWLLQTFVPLGPVAIVILFYPELRHALEEMGKVAGWSRGFARLPSEDVTTIIKEISAAASRMSSQSVGALIVLERDLALDDIAASGRRVQAEVSCELLCTIFHPGSALHDGAVIIRGSRILAAGCILPLSDSVHIGTMIHTRHKAAIGVSEVSDAAVVVVSEETGIMSLAIEGKLHSGLNQETLSKWLHTIFGTVDKDKRSNFKKTVDVTLRRTGLRI
ncbi:MAG: TIGR00159 family protein [Armatimonadetes bacterium]|nr:TIGR00159 family protein [Armatimonadota bacterium]